MQQSQQSKVINIKTTPVAIVCKNKDSVLTVQIRQGYNYFLHAQPFNPQNKNQMFLLIVVNQSKNRFIIVHYLTNMLLTVKNQEIVLNQQNQQESQIFQIVKNPVQQFYTYYWMKSIEERNKSLELQYSLKLKSFRSTQECQLFRFQDICFNNVFKETFKLIHSFTKKDLQYSGSPLKLEGRIMLADTSERYNQRWFWVKYGKGYLIGNCLTQFFVDIQKEQPCHGAKVVLREKTGEKGQIWVPESQGNNKYIIRSGYVPSLILSIKTQSFGPSSEVQLSQQKNHCSRWQIDGALP